MSAQRVLLLPAPAKLNMFLHVTGRRADGYHTLETLFVLIGRSDTISLALRDDGLRTGAAGLGLGFATGVAAVLSASIGFLLAGIAVAAAAGALLLIQVIFSRNIAARFTGALSIAILTSLFAVGSRSRASRGRSGRRIECRSNRQKADFRRR